MASLQIRTGEINLEILDDQGESRGFFKFNPEDIQTARRFVELEKEFKKAQSEFEKRSEKCETPEEQIVLLDEVCTYYKGVVDECFGEGSSAVLFGEAKSLSMFEDFINGISPYYQEASKKRMAKYSDKKKK